MTNVARSGTGQDILLLGPSAVRTNAAHSLLAFVRWTREHQPTPPRAVLLASGPMQGEFRAAGARVLGEPRPSPLQVVEGAAKRLGVPKLAKAARLARHGAALNRPPTPRCVYASTIQAAGPALRVLPRGARLVVHAYETGEVVDELVAPPMQRRLASATAAWIATADDVAAGLRERGVAPERIVQVDPFIDDPDVDPGDVRRARQVLALRPGEVVVGGVGRSDWRDGPDAFIRVAAVLRRRHPELPVRFVWAGAPADGPTRWVLEHDVRNAGLSEVFTFASDELVDEAWLSVCDVLCVTSRTDPPPPSVLQAGALGIPVAGFAVSGLQQLASAVARHGDAPPASGPSAAAGVHVVPYLDAEAMVAALAALAVDEEARRRGGDRLRSLVLESRLASSGAPRVWGVLERVSAAGAPGGSPGARRAVAAGAVERSGRRR